MQLEQVCVSETGQGLDADLQFIMSSCAFVALTDLNCSDTSLTHTDGRPQLMTNLAGFSEGGGGVGWGGNDTF